MNISLKDRITLMVLLPQKGSFTDLILRKDILNKIELTQEEILEFGVTSTETGITWKPNDKQFDINFTDLEKDLIKKSLKELDDKKEAQPDHLTLWELFK